MLNAAKNNSLSPAGPMALRVLLLLVVALCLGQTRVWGFAVTPQPASGVFESVTPSSIGENYDGCPYDASDSLLAAKYGDLPDPRNVGPNKEFTPATKKKILERNRAENDGVIRSDQSGTEAVPSAKSESGVKPPQNEAQIDHIKPKSKGGTNSPSNAQVLTRTENRRKSNN